MYVRVCESDRAFEAHIQVARMLVRCEDLVLQAMSTRPRKGTAMLRTVDTTSESEQLEGINTRMPCSIAVWNSGDI